jgi:hypothetical protein
VAQGPSGGYIVVLKWAADPAAVARRQGAKVSHLYRYALKGTAPA